MRITLSGRSAKQPGTGLRKTGWSPRTLARHQAEGQALLLLRQLVQARKRRGCEQLLLGFYITSRRDNTSHYVWGRLALRGQTLAEQTGTYVRGVLCRNSCMNPERPVSPSLKLVRRYNLKALDLATILARVHPKP